MADRFVLPLDPASDRKLRFSECLQYPNIVLLGDPGAGKSHLFHTFAPPNSLFRARDFLNWPLQTLREHTTLFIDALDEKRSSRTDVAPVDLIVNRLMELKPRQVRIACRAADWLGTSDLGAFRTYFDVTGSFTVLALEALTEAESAEVLTSLGCADPAAFMTEANARGIGDLLGNPQNLTMLFHVVQSHDWPYTRSDLYRKAVEVLLTEHNPEHHHKDAGIYSAQELMLAAGAACAVRLIADVNGISLTGARVADCPTYRDLSFVPAPQLHAALKRRVFSTTGIPDTVDYSHRTVAEYLAAHFLAHQVQDGLPFGRVRALISVDGRPASELRGLHAWLAVLLPEHARELIRVDPFGVLSYGDASALNLPDRDALLEAMAELAKEDPWFRRDNWSAAPLRGLAGADMVDHFRAILRDSDNYSLVSVVLHAATVGTQMPALRPDFEQILLQASRTEGERLMALEALLHMGPTAHATCVSAYASIAAEPNGFHLRSRVLRYLVRLGLVGPAEISDLLNDGLASQSSGIITIELHQFEEQVPDSMLLPILQRVQLQRLPEQSPDSHDTREALRVLDRLLARYVVLNPEDLNFAAKWLSDRAHVARYHGYTVDDALQTVLQGDPERLQKLIDAALPHIQETQAWPIVRRLGEILPGAADAAAILTWALRKLAAMAATPNPLHYAIAMDCVFSARPLSRAEFEHLVALASKNPPLQPICADACCCPIPDWRIEQSVRRASDAAKRAGDRSRTLQDFDQHVEAIRAGTHLAWLGHIAQVYFCLYADCNRSSSPAGRLIDLLGAERTDLALAGLRALVATGHSPSMQDILAKHADQKVFRWWYAIVAGLDEHAAASDDLGQVPTDYLACAIAINVLYPTYKHAGNTTSVIRHAWAAWFAEHHPKRYANTLLEIVRFQLQRSSQYLYGFSELLQSGPAQSVAVRDLLTSFPQAPPNYLVQLLRTWISQQPETADRSVIRTGLRKSKRTASHALWLATALVVDFARFRSQAAALRKKDAQRALVWASRDLLGYTRSVPLAYTEYLFRMTCRNFMRAEMPSTSTGDRDQWDATQFALRLLNTLAADMSEAGQRALRRAVEDRETRRFRDDIKHAIAQQQIRRIDAEFRQPSWNATLSTLANGAPANIADLQALVLAELRDMQVSLAGSNVDLYKNFWNEGPHGKVKAPKSENSCRNVLVEVLRPKMKAHGIRVEPEGQMAHVRRTDIAVTCTNMKLVMELKRHYHPKVWSAASQQLDRFYVRDPEAKGFGIYVVFWFGPKKPTPALERNTRRPRSADEMASVLTERLPADQRLRIACVVLDVSGDGFRRRTRKSPITRKRKSPRKKGKSRKTGKGVQ